MDLILLGAGGQAKDTIKNIDDYNTEVSRRKRINLIGCIDDTTKKSNSEIAGYPIFDNIKILGRTELKNVFVLCSVGDPLNKLKFLEKIEPYHPQFCNIIHPSITLHRTMKFGVGISIFALSVISAFCEIGNHVSINYLCSISHDCKIGDHVTLSPGVKIAGRVIIKENVFIGINSCCVNNIILNPWCVVGAGTTVISDVESSVIVAGNPQKVIGKREKNKSII